MILSCVSSFFCKNKGTISISIEADTNPFHRYGHLTSPHFSPFNYLYWVMFTVLFA